MWAPGSEKAPCRALLLLIKILCVPLLSIITDGFRLSAFAYELLCIIFWSVAYVLRNISEVATSAGIVCIAIRLDRHVPAEQLNGEREFGVFHLDKEAFLLGY
jgi:hypothetical protein